MPAATNLTKMVDVPGVAPAAAPPADAELFAALLAGGGDAVAPEGKPVDSAGEDEEPEAADLLIPLIDRQQAAPAGPIMVAPTVSSPLATPGGEPAATKTDRPAITAGDPEEVPEVRLASNLADPGFVAPVPAPATPRQVELETQAASVDQVTKAAIPTASKPVGVRVEPQQIGQPWALGGSVQATSTVSDAPMPDAAATEPSTQAVPDLPAMRAPAGEPRVVADVARRSIGDAAAGEDSEPLVADPGNAIPKHVASASQAVARSLAPIARQAAEPPAAAETAAEQPVPKSSVAMRLKQAIGAATAVQGAPKFAAASPVSLATLAGDFSRTNSAERTPGQPDLPAPDAGKAAEQIEPAMPEAIRLKQAIGAATAVQGGPLSGAASPVSLVALAGDVVRTDKADSIPGEVNAPAPAEAKADTVVATMVRGSSQEQAAPISLAPLAAAAAPLTADFRMPTGSLGQALAAQVLDMAGGDAWIDQLSRDIGRIASGTGDMRFRLTPETLGELRVEISQSDRGAMVRMSVSSEAAQAALADAAPKLIAEARAQGVRIADTQIDLAGSQQQHREGHRQAAAPEHPVRALRSPTNPDSPAAELARARPADRYA